MLSRVSISFVSLSFDLSIPDQANHGCHSPDKGHLHLCLRFQLIRALPDAAGHGHKDLPACTSRVVNIYTCA